MVFSIARCALAVCLLAACATPTPADEPAIDKNLLAACTDLPSAHAVWFSEASISTAVIERLHLFDSLDPQKVTGMEMDRVSAPTDTFHAKVITYSDLYVRHLSSALVMYGAETKILAELNKNRNTDRADMPGRIRWALDQVITAWTGFRALCPSPATPSLNVAAPEDALAQARRHLDTLRTHLPLPPSSTPQVARCDDPAASPASPASDERFRAVAQADITLTSSHMDAMVHLATSSMRASYQATELRELIPGGGRARLEMYEPASGTRITMASTAAQLMHLTVTTLCFLPSPGHHPFPH